MVWAAEKEKVPFHQDRLGGNKKVISNKLNTNNSMDKKFCDKCEEEISGYYYVVLVNVYNTENFGEVKEAHRRVELCPTCYKKIESSLKR